MFIINISEKAESCRVYRAFQFCKLKKKCLSIKVNCIEKNLEGHILKGYLWIVELLVIFFLFFLVYILIFFKPVNVHYLCDFFKVKLKINKQTKIKSTLAEM